MMDSKEISSLFSKIAKRYDFLNHFFSLNIDRKWRREVVEQVRGKPFDTVLDVCTGTGDLAIEFALRTCAKEIIGIDLSEEMLCIGRDKLRNAGLQKRIKLIRCNALSIPFKDNSFDIVSIGFGLRNLIDYESGISEMVRVLNDNGSILILEFSTPPDTLFGRSYRFYLETIMPAIGGGISGLKGAYRYLSWSIDNFLEVEEVLELMDKKGLKKLSHKKLTGGIAYIYRGEK